MIQRKIFVTSAKDEESALSKILLDLNDIGIIAKGKILKQTLNGNYFVKTEFDIPIKGKELDKFLTNIGDGLIR